MPQLQSKSFRHANKREEVVPERITDGKHNYVSAVLSSLMFRLVVAYVIQLHLTANWC